jgi:hypothetical protein
MPTALTPQEQVLMQQETDYLDLDIPVFGSTVIQWRGSNVLIFHSASDGYFTTDITDLGPSVVTQLSSIGSTTPTIWGMITAIPASVQQTVASEANTALQAAKSLGIDTAALAQSVSDATGKALAGLAGPLISTLTPVLIGIGVVLLLMYIPKKG